MISFCDLICFFRTPSNGQLLFSDRRFVFARILILVHASTLSVFKQVKLRRAQVWHELQPRADGSRARVIVEPMIEGAFIKFNSNTGYTNGSNVRRPPRIRSAEFLFFEGQNMRFA